MQRGPAMFWSNFCSTARSDSRQSKVSLYNSTRPDQIVQVTRHVDLPMAAVYGVQFLTFGGGLFGISYGILSASWDPRLEGSRLGWTEFRANLPLIIERMRENGGRGRV